MTAEYKKLLQSLQKKEYAPVYLTDGDESYYLDQITEYFEEKIIPPAERDFNLIVLYGKDSTWADVVNACRRFPMFAERQVVILKDAAQLKDFGNLAGYIEKPSPTTILLIEHRFKKADNRSKVVKLVKEKGIYFTSEKIKDDHVPAWIQAYGEQTGFRVGPREAEILSTYLGNDLQKITNEIAKVRINVPDEPALTAAMIQKYIGISHDYNIFEFAEALTGSDREKMFRMLAYFISHTQAVPMPLLIGSFYSHFSRLYQGCFLQGKPIGEAAKALGTFPKRAGEIIQTARRLSLPRIEYCLLLLGQYSTYAVGIDRNADGAELLKEMIGKMDMALSQ
jgi:DNA polymerase-3 subunit delta